MKVSLKTDLLKYTLDGQKIPEGEEFDVTEVDSPWMDGKMFMVLNRGEYAGKLIDPAMCMVIEE